MLLIIGLAFRYPLAHSLTPEITDPNRIDIYDQHRCLLLTLPGPPQDMGGIRVQNYEILHAQPSHSKSTITTTSSIRLTPDPTPILNQVAQHQ